MRGMIVRLYCVYSCIADDKGMTSAVEIYAVDIVVAEDAMMILLHLLLMMLPIELLLILNCLL